MKINDKEIRKLISNIDSIIDSAIEFEEIHKSRIEKAHPDYRKSAVNLVHYLALRKHDISDLQEAIADFGLTPFEHIEPHVMRSLLLTKTILQNLVGENSPLGEHKTISAKKARKLLNKNTQLLFGKKSKKRRTRIMVTMPSEVASDRKMVQKFLKAGMNCARINCAHDNPEKWKLMIDNIRDSARKLKKECRITMDLAGPKLRTGAMTPGHRVIHIKPQRDDLGNISKPARIWLIAQGGIIPASADVVIPVDSNWLQKARRGDIVQFEDSRGKNCTIEIVKKQKEGRWALCYDSTYITTGTEMVLKKPNKPDQSLVLVGDLLPLEQWITLKPGDYLTLHKKPDAGENAVIGDDGRVIKPAHISCPVNEIYTDTKPNEPILFDDGKIEGLIEMVGSDELLIKITNAKQAGSKLRSEKGINLPASNLQFSGMTEKDFQDFAFVVENADVVNVSFVNDVKDVNPILEQFERFGKQTGLILKIETRKGFRNLPLILLEAMQVRPLGVMIARGDLAVEAGWNNMAILQEEILRICEAAHIPDIWATQVLDEMSKKGIPSRAELTDAGMSQRAECVMLNKGDQITKAIKMLDQILRKMQEIKKKKESVLPKLPDAEKLNLHLVTEATAEKTHILNS
jgi:pyruvate kinase